MHETLRSAFFEMILQGGAVMNNLCSLLYIWVCCVSDRSKTILEEKVGKRSISASASSRSKAISIENVWIEEGPESIENFPTSGAPFTTISNEDAIKDQGFKNRPKLVRLNNSMRPGHNLSGITYAISCCAIHEMYTYFEGSEA